MSRKFIWVASAFALLLFLAGNAVAGDYANAKVYLDTVIEDPATNDSTTTVRVPVAGGEITFQVFIPSAADGSTFGFNLDFEDTLNIFTDNFGVKTATKGWSGALTGAGATWSSLDVSGATVPSTGLIATVTCTAKVDVADTVTISLKATSTTMADPNFANDVLDVSGAIITFTTGPKLAAGTSVSAPIPLPINSSASVTVTATGFAADATLIWTVTEAAGATAAITTSESGAANTITATGPGSATVTVSASDGTEATNDVSMTFSQQEAAELATFGGEMVDDRVLVSWSTASQTNNAGWRILRSVDGENFEPLSQFVQGAGTSDALLSYSLEDVNLPSSETVWYQLEQVDLDGSVTRSNAIEVVLGARMPVPTEFATNVYPNPFNPSTTISYDLPNESFVSVVIYDAIGQEVRRLVTEQTPAGRYRVQWDALDSQGRSVGSGVYIAKVEAGSFSSSQKMLLLK